MKFGKGIIIAMFLHRCFICRMRHIDMEFLYSVNK